MPIQTNKYSIINLHYIIAVNLVCKLHIAFHGCLQGYHYISNVFAMFAGYNGIAEINNIIVLYPQVKNSTLNPKGCWDWYNYNYILKIVLLLQ